jgi:hypothetical protein
LSSLALNIVHFSIGLSLNGAAERKEPISHN